VKLTRFSRLVALKSEEELRDLNDRIEREYPLPAVIQEGPACLRVSQDSSRGEK